MIDAIVGTDFVLSLGLTLVHFLWQGSAIALFTAALLAVCRRATAATRYNIACAGLLAMTLAPMLTVTGSMTRPVMTRALQLPAANVLVVEGGGAVTGSITAQLAPWLPVLVGIWSLGVAVLTIRLVRSWWSTERVRRVGTHPVSGAMEAAVARMARSLGVRRRITLSESALIDVPTVIGWIRPTILMPLGALAGLSTHQIEAVISHELAHIRRHDYLVNGLQNVVETLLFYHPGVWWVSRQIRIEREHCCDDVAVAACGNRIAYARALASLEEGRQHRATLALAATDGPLLTRIRRLLGAPVDDDYRPSLSIAAGIVAVLVAAAFSVAQARGATPASAGSVAGSLPPVEESIIVASPADARAEGLGDAPAINRANPANQANQTNQTNQPDQANDGTAAPPQAPLRVGGGIREPRKIADVRPVYPDVARAADVSGVVILEATIDPQGNVAGVRVLRSIPLLDQAAIDAVRQWKYAPALLNGAAVSVMMTVTVNFSLAPPAADPAAPQTPDDSRTSEEQLDAMTALLERARQQNRQVDNNFAPNASDVLRVGGDIREPRKVHDARPAYPAAARAAGVSGVVILETIIDAQGAVADVRVLRSVPLLDEAAIEAVRQWRYEPVIVDGAATPVRMTVTVNFTLN
jgi:TonB family protein